MLTAMPNYPQMQIHADYRGLRYHYSDMEGLKVHRSSIYVSRSKSIVNRLRNYFSFVSSSARASGRLEANYDVLLCESPPLFLGYSAMYLSRKKRARLVFNVSDLWPESAEKLGVVNNALLLKIAYRLEARLYRRSALVTGQTQGICKSISQRFPEVQTYWLPNGVDLAYYNPEAVEPGDWRQKNGLSETDTVFLYAGIIGLAQGLEVIVEAAESLKHRTDVKFVLMGSGPEKDKLMQLSKEKGTTNVLFLEPVTKKEMPAVLRSVNAAIVPLKKLDLFLGAIPSKIFENLAMCVPVLLGVDGEARELFIKQGKCGLYFEPESSVALANAVLEFLDNKSVAAELGKNGRRYVQQFFNREKIAADFLEQLKRLK